MIFIDKPLFIIILLIVSILSVGAPIVTSTVDFEMGNAADMNMVVSDMPDEVLIDDSGGCWVNQSGVVVTIDVYGDSEDEPMNASLKLSGCGLAFTIDEDDDPTHNEYLEDKDDGWYQVLINPKMGGVITITATNNTDEKSVTKDFSVKGLTGGVTTSIDDDLVYTFGAAEIITATIINGQYADVYLIWFNDDWSNGKIIRKIIGDGETEGEGLNGVFTFQLTEYDLPDDSGNILIVGEAAGRYLYEIIEIEIPVMVDMMILGRISNLYTLNETSTFVAGNIVCITIPFSNYRYDSNEKMIISNNYHGFVTNSFIIGLFKGYIF